MLPRESPTRVTPPGGHDHIGGNPMKSKHPNQSGAAAIVVATLAIVGCGGSSSSSTSASGTAASGTMTKEQAAHTYLAAVAKPNEVLRTFLAKANGWTDSTPSTQAAADAKPLIDAITTLRTKLQALAAAYPAAANDLKAVVAAQAVLQGDLASLAAVNALNASSFAQTVTRDARALRAATAMVRSHLGLPPPPTS
jgi:hypothetical protein